MQLGSSRHWDSSQWQLAAPCRMRATVPAPAPLQDLLLQEPPAWKTQAQTLAQAHPADNGGSQITPCLPCLGLQTDVLANKVFDRDKDAQDKRHSTHTYTHMGHRALSTQSQTESQLHRDLFVNNSNYHFDSVLMRFVAGNSAAGMLPGCRQG